MIKSFRDRDSEHLFNDRRVKRFSAIARQARRKLLLLNAVKSLDELRSPPGNSLEELKGDRRGQHSIRVNDQYRICFRWMDGNAWNVEVVDHH